jgi:alanyl-tRNA synthetase
MKTDRAYHTHAYQTEFKATVIRTTTIHDLPGVILDRTLFYPTSGGQPHDTGTLQGMPVLEVIEQNEEIIHLMGSGIPTGEVNGRIDWRRRFDHMQQHTGQHVLSQACLQILGAETIGFHLGEETSTIDLDISDLNWESIRRVENEANRIVFQNLAVRIHEATAETLHHYPLRKAPVVNGSIRILEIDNYDWSACCGTHVQKTGEIGLIKINHFEKYKQGYRAAFFCGYRALDVLQQKTELLEGASRRLTSSETNLIAGIDKLLAQQKQLKTCEKELLAYEASACFDGAQKTGKIFFIHDVFPNRNIKAVQRLCRQITDHPNTVCLFGIRSKRATIILGQSENGPLDLGKLTVRICELLGGKGGGNTRQIQVSGTNVSLLMPSLKKLVDQIINM